MTTPFFKHFSYYFFTLVKNQLNLSLEKYFLLVSSLCMSHNIVSFVSVAEIKKNVKVKWKRKFELSEKVDNIQEVFTEVGCRHYFSEEDRESFSALNQLLVLSGHSILNSHKQKWTPVFPTYAVIAKSQKTYTISCFNATQDKKGHSTDYSGGHSEQRGIEFH